MASVRPLLLSSSASTFSSSTSTHARLCSISSSITKFRAFCKSAGGRLIQPPDVAKLAQDAKIALTPAEIEEFQPKIRQVVDWFAQLQNVDLESVEPTLGAVSGLSEHLREDSPEVFGNREAMLSSVPCYDEPYIKVPKILNKD